MDFTVPGRQKERLRTFEYGRVSPFCVALKSTISNTVGVISMFKCVGYCSHLGPAPLLSSPHLHTNSSCSHLHGARSREVELTVISAALLTPNSIYIHGTSAALTPPSLAALLWVSGQLVFYFYFFYSVAGSWLSSTRSNTKDTDPGRWWLLSRCDQRWPSATRRTRRSRCPPTTSCARDSGACWTKCTPSRGASPDPGRASPPPLQVRKKTL